MPARPLIRPATRADLPAIQSIYAHHVLQGLGSFEEVPPDLGEMLASGRPEAAAASADALQFLLQVMNDDTVALALRVEAAKALLQHASDARSLRST